MSRQTLILKRLTPPGAEPGAIMSNPSATATTVQVLEYDQEALTFKNVESLSDLPSEDSVNSKNGKRYWISVCGLANLEFLEGLAQKYDLHKLAIEDVLNLHQRPKVDEYDDIYFLIAQSMRFKDNHLYGQQVSIFVKNGLVISFEESSPELLSMLEHRLRDTRSHLRFLNSDYLVYAMLDAIVDSYFPVLEKLGERLEDLEDDIISSPNRSVVAKIHLAKRNLILLRKAVWPLRDAINQILRDDSSCFTDETKLYLRDCYDHLIRVMELAESYRELSSDLMDIYLSSLSNRMNEIIKVLTIISTLFIPATFIASVYGMNFQPAISPYNMPELNWYFGYPYAWALMAISFLAMIWLMAKLGWLGELLGKK
jgi:magnesium transporter